MAAVATPIATIDVTCSSGILFLGNRLGSAAVGKVSYAKPLVPVWQMLTGVYVVKLVIFTTL